MLDQFLNIDKITDSETKAATPPATITSFGVATPISVATSTTPGATRSTPLRSVRMSPGSHEEDITPPKKGEDELPPPMSLEQAVVEAFGNLGVYPEIEQWRDNRPVGTQLSKKIRTSHIQVLIFLFSKF
jgi:hypothetical protein